MPTLSKSTKPAPRRAPAKGRRKTAPTFAALKGDPDETATDEAKAALEKELSDQKDARLEERFVWIVVAVILLDIIWFHDSTNAALPVVVMILELVALMVLARRMGVDDFVQLIGRVLHGIGNKGSS
jgi:hypothetical protein